ncbi:DUF4292 domain-containing protein [Pelobium manganitolerans]|uniref:DUF4292 domain-containing protein n=1 Tax=Pelobium manganitolerans TaxID=1842495 RepID=UPI003FA372BD
MKRNILSKLLVLAFCVAAISCKSKKNLVGSAPSNTNETELSERASINLKKIVAKQSDFKTLNTRANSRLSIKNKNFDVTMNMRIKKGEGVWISVTYFAGIEVARALITPDSIKVLDKINETYLKKPFSFVHKYSNDQIDYATLEAILIGNAVPLTIANKSNISVAPEGLVASGQQNGLAYHVNFNSDFKPASTNLKTTDGSKNLSVAIPVFENIAGVLVPKSLNLSSQALSNSVKVDMEYNKTVLNEPVDFPFNVSKRFSVIE